MNASVNHFGITVTDLDDSLTFWESFLDTKASGRYVVEGEFIGQLVGYPGVRLEVARVDLPGPGGVMLELVQYLNVDGQPNPEATANPGNGHVCFTVENAQAAWERAIELGARPVSPGGPVDVVTGANAGARTVYLRVPDGITLELFQRPPAHIQ